MARRALVIGINKYRDGYRTLYRAAGGAREIESRLTSNGPGGEPWEVRCLNDERHEVTRAAVKFAFDKFCDVVGEGDDLLFYFAGHADRSPGATQLSLIAADGESLSLLELKNLAETLKNAGREPGSVTVVLDCCQAGQLPDGMEASRNLEGSKTAYFLAAREEAYEHRQLGGRFTWRLLEGLDGGAVDPESEESSPKSGDLRRVTTRSLKLWLDRIQYEVNDGGLGQTFTCHVPKSVNTVLTSPPQTVGTAILRDRNSRVEARPFANTLEVEWLIDNGRERLGWPREVVLDPVDRALAIDVAGGTGIYAVVTNGSPEVKAKHRRTKLVRFDRVERRVSLTWHAELVPWGATRAEFLGGEDLGWVALTDSDGNVKEFSVSALSATASRPDKP